MLPSLDCVRFASFSLKFVDTYELAVQPYLESPSGKKAKIDYYIGNGINIHASALWVSFETDLLFYCGYTLRLKYTFYYRVVKSHESYYEFILVQF